MLAATDEPLPGWYGKLAMLGDFAQRRLPDEVVHTCDQWLATTMHALPQVLGDRWPWAYLEAPLLRFACAPGVLTPDWWFGVLMPSCDNVGRYFPLWVAQPRAQPPQGAVGLESLAAWYDALAGAAVRTLEDGASVAEFEAELAALSPWRADAEVAASRAGAGGVLAQTLPGAVNALAASALMGQLGGCTLWWPTTRPPGRPSPLRCVQGLPDVQEVAMLLQAELERTA